MIFRPEDLVFQFPDGVQEFFGNKKYIKLDTGHVVMPNEPNVSSIAYFIAHDRHIVASNVGNASAIVPPDQQIAVYSCTENPLFDIGNPEGGSYLGEPTWMSKEDFYRDYNVTREYKGRYFASKARYDTKAMKVNFPFVFAGAVEGRGMLVTFDSDGYIIAGEDGKIGGWFTRDFSKGFGAAGSNKSFAMDGVDDPNIPKIRFKPGFDKLYHRALAIISDEAKRVL